MHSFIALAAIVVGASSAPPKVAMPSLSVIGFDDRLADFYAEHLAQQLKFEGLQIVTQKEIATLLGFERQKALLGCNEASSACVAELANALGADGVALGDIAKVGAKTQINLKVISAADGKTLSAFSERVEGEEAVLDALTRAAEKLAKGVAQSMGRTIVPVALELRGGTSEPAGKKTWWIPAVGGALVAGAGAILFVSGSSDYNKLMNATAAEPIGVSEAQSLRDGGKLKEGLAVACFIAGGAAVAVGTVLFATSRGGSEKAPTVSVVPGPGGGAVVVSGVLP